MIYSKMLINAMNMSKLFYKNSGKSFQRKLKLVSEIIHPGGDVTKRKSPPIKVN